jgi:hypothetical protein
MVLSNAPVSAGRTLLQHHLRQVSLALGTVLAGATIAACGGSSPTAVSATHLLSQTFTANLGKIRSGELALTVRADLDGVKRLGGKPVSLQLSGPFTEHAGSVTAFDFSATVTEAGSTLPVTVLSTGKAFYIEFGGTYYTLPSPLESSLAKVVRSSTGTGGFSTLLTKLGINPLAWLRRPKLVGTTMVSGVETDHLTTRLDVAQLLGEVAKLMSASSVIAGSSSLARALTPANLDQIASTVKSARVGVYSGAGDHILREFSAALNFTIPTAAQRSLGGLTGGSFELDATIANLNAAEAITPPSSSEPFRDLLGASGGVPSL